MRNTRGCYRAKQLVCSSPRTDLHDDNNRAVFTDVAGLDLRAGVRHNLNAARS